MNRFLQREAPGLQMDPRRLRIGLMPEREMLLAHVDRGADVLADPLGGQRPGLVEQADLTVGFGSCSDVNRGSMPQNRHRRTTCPIARGWVWPPRKIASLSV